MKFRVIALIVVYLAVGFGLGQVHKSKEAKELTEKIEKVIVNGSKELSKNLKKGAKELSKKLNDLAAKE